MALMLSTLYCNTGGATWLAQMAQWSILAIVVAAGWSYARAAVGHDDRAAAKRGAGLIVLVVVLAVAAMTSDLWASALPFNQRCEECQAQMGWWYCFIMRGCA